MDEEFRVRFRDPHGRQLLSLPEPSAAGAIRHARVIELHHGTILAIAGPDGEVSWDEVRAMAEGLVRTMLPTG
jgi:hypothetical protein